jgi:hypothetical protein
MHIRILILVILAVGILTAGLTSQGYTIDEPETMAVASAINKFWVPSAWDGTNLQHVSGPQAYKIINDVYVWKWHPWIQHYLAWIGRGSRWPFALCGVVVIILFFFVCQAYFKKRNISFLLSLQLLFSLPFFLYIRQVRYYAPTALANLVVFYLLLVPRTPILMFIAGLGLFMSNYQSWFSTFIFAVPFLAFHQRWKEVVAWLMTLVIAIGWYSYFDLYGGNLLIASAHPAQFIANLLKYLSYTNSYYFPLILIPLIWVARRESSPRFLYLAIGWIAIKLALMTIFFTPHGRYLVELAPLFILIIGYIYLKFPKLSFVLWGVLITTNLLSLRSPWKYYPPMFASELIGNHPTMASQVAAYIKSQAVPGDLFWANNEQTSIYLGSGVPHISNVCINNAIQGPVAVTDPGQIKWLVFFQYDGRIYQDISTVPCLQDINLSLYSKRIFPFKYPTYAYNDIDIVNRRYPPQVIVDDEVVIYERNSIPLLK